MKEKLLAFERLLHIMDDLREKCPWDKKQTTESLRQLSIEEVYELSEAILKKDPTAVKEELGDLFLHLVFYSKIGEEEGNFNVADVLHAVCDKLVHRHPHIYGDVVANTEEEVLKNWEKLKLKEGKKSVLEGVPSGMPAINKAIRLQEKTAKIGFEWDRIEEVWLKVEEEQAELQAAIQSKEQEHVEEEFGDLLFALLNYSRFLKIDAEAALEKTNQKFKKRFEFIEERAKSLGKNLEDMSLAEMDAIWNEAKKA